MILELSTIQLVGGPRDGYEIPIVGDTDYVLEILSSPETIVFTAQDKDGGPEDYYMFLRIVEDVLMLRQVHIG